MPQPLTIENAPEEWRRDGRTGKPVSDEDLQNTIDITLAAEQWQREVDAADAEEDRA